MNNLRKSRPSRADRLYLIEEENYKAVWTKVLINRYGLVVFGYNKEQDKWVRNVYPYNIPSLVGTQKRFERLEDFVAKNFTDLV